jgi:hypothetical protein
MHLILSAFWYQDNRDHGAFSHCEPVISLAVVGITSFLGYRLDALL